MTEGGQPTRRARIVDARDVSIEYRPDGTGARHRAVKGISFDLLDGEILGIIGDSGSGKSTLAATVAGVSSTTGGGSAGGLQPDRVPDIVGGSLTVCGYDMRRITQREREDLALEVGYLAQDGVQRLSPGLTVAETVAEPIYQRDRRFDRREAGQAVATLIDAVHLPLSALDRPLHELSSGQRQRVALARALILEPTLLIADEPLRGVDFTLRGDVLDVIPELQSERRFSAIVVSSDLAVIRHVARRIAVVHDGVIIGVGPLELLVAAPEHPYLKQLARAVRSQTLPMTL
ncbi:ATP-binding cassette domain-containing protein [Marisediminicola senii]|uniref:ATP-binding cassette domain-containing protein n=1 Tax=Marisediminicola senii TaxID=2711233 RepID=UPI0013ED382F|nr:ATP-binding cassette domain-containing protein [Marisediminicola senii]